MLTDLSLAELKPLITESGQPLYRAGQLYKRLMAGDSADAMTELPKAFRARLFDRYDAAGTEILKTYRAKDGTYKYLFGLRDGQTVEGALMSQAYGATLCVSTQAGCRMGCRFCASGLNGLIRNLSPGEILGQVVAVNRAAGGTAERRAITNLVLMGSGEPLDNYDSVTAFLRLVTAEDGLRFSQRNISLSTSGLAPGIRRLADDGFSVTLSISLHATADEQRSAVMPINARYPIAEVLGAARYYFEKTGRRVHIEYAMIEGLNVNYFDAKRLATLLKGFPVHVNLLYLNSVPERQLKSTSKPAGERFLERLKALGVNATVRKSRGSDVGGACGQLRARHEAGRNEAPKA
ncbi:MAG: 23S rRNA (adenine(2503)-C(2))-methyltransferase RlmN [Clostridiales bacterium]|nr:23S rRNA (adenine(2503)-C(2))-methyltransferase RlmN [Clostridiales bacterium]